MALTIDFILDHIAAHARDLERTSRATGIPIEELVIAAVQRAAELARNPPPEESAHESEDV